MPAAKPWLTEYGPAILTGDEARPESIRMTPPETGLARRFVHAFVRRPTLASAFGWALGCTAAATLLRLALNPVFGGDYPYVTYFLSVTLASGLGGFRAGLLALGLSIAAAWFLFLTPQSSFVLRDINSLASVLIFSLNVGVLAICPALLRTALWQMAEGERKQALLAQELNHRVKNNIAAVQSLAIQTAKETPDLDAFLRTFQGRIVALGRTHELLSQSQWEGLDVGAVVAAETAPYGPARFAASGPRIVLPPAAAVSLGMIVHELATNAAKYGALQGDGRVAVNWRVDGSDGELSWRETGGPPVSHPARIGLGTRLIERLARGDLGGDVAFDYAPEGLAATVRFRRRKARRSAEVRPTRPPERR